MLFPYFLHILHFTNSHVEALCLWKISAHGKIKSGEKKQNRPKAFGKEIKKKKRKERTILSRKEKNSFVKATGTTGGPSSSCEMIILRNNSHGGIIRVCMGIFTTALRNKKNTSNSQKKNTSPYFHSVSFVN